jgi:uncharacterized membrane protein YgaE (UPF0421/DUF939 family)
MESKICGKCKVLLPTNNFIYFFEKSRKKWRYASYCKSCQKENAKKHYRDNQEKYIDLANKWQINNQEKHNQICCEYQKRVRSKLTNSYITKLLDASEISREFITKNPEIIESRRLQVKIKRKIKELKNGTQQVN